jgi:putative transcriptional regulator
LKNHNLIKARKGKNLTQEQLAELLDCKKTTISNWENGYSKPTLDDAYKVAEVLESDINHLFFGYKVQETHTLDQIKSS